MSMLKRQRRGNSLAQANGLGKQIKNPEGLKGRDKLDTFCILPALHCPLGKSTNQSRPEGTE
jgi:hypothetical protein